MNIIALLLTLFAGLFIIIGSALGIYSKNSKSVIDMSISIAFGVIIGLMALEVMPDSYKVLSGEIGTFRSIIAIIILVIIGILLLKILDMFVPCHEHESSHDHEHINDDCHNEHLLHVGVLFGAAILVHNIIEGAGLYLIAKGDTTNGLLFCLGIGLHNIPLGLVATTSIINSNMKKTRMLLILTLITVSSFIGGFIIALLGSISAITEGILLGLTLGMLVYISVFELSRQIYHMENKTLTRMCILFGLLILTSSVLIGHFLGE